MQYAAPAVTKLNQICSSQLLSSITFSQSATKQLVQHTMRTCVKLTHFDCSTVTNDNVLQCVIIA